MNVLRLPFIILLIHSCFALHGQTCLFEKTLPYPCFSTSQPNAVLSVDSVNWVIAGFAGDCYTAYLAKIDCEGDVIWERYPCGYSKFLHAVPTKHGDILAAGYDWGQDDVGSDEYAVLMKYSSDGTEIFRKYFVTHQTGDSYFNQVVESSIGEIYVSFDDKVYRLSSSGDSLASLSFGYGKIKCMLNSRSGDLVFGCDSGLVVLDSMGNLTRKIRTGAVGAIIQNQQSQYVLSTNGYLTLLDTAFTFVNSTPSNQVLALEQADSGFLVLLRTGVLYYDWNLSPTGTIWTNSRMNVIDIASNGSRITIAGTYNVVKNLMLVKGIDYSGNSVESDADLKLEEVEITDIQKIFRDFIPYGPVIYDLMFTAEVKVINVGLDSIESFNLVSQSFGGMNCSDWRFTFPVSGVHIAPQDTMTYTINRAYYYFYQSNFKLCLDGVSVNGGRDADLSNNSSCTETILLSAGDIEVPPLISVYPNPVSDILYLGLNESNQGVVEIFSVNGMMLSSLHLNNGLNAISINHLESNLYFVRIVTSDDKVFCQKIIKL